jgi:glycosyltransferase involved in cell wall biosynthesis
MTERRLLFVHDGKMNGIGLDLVSDYLLRSLADSDVRVTFVSRGRVDYPHVRCVVPPLNPAKLAAWLPRPYYYGASKRFFSSLGARELARHHYDAAMAWARGARALFTAARALRVKTVLHAGNLHCDSDTEPQHPWPAISKPYRRDEYGLADRLFVASDNAAADFVAHGVDSARVSVLHRGFDPLRFYPAERLPSVFRVLFCGHLGERKGLPQVLEAWHLAALTGAELWLVGGLDGSMRPVLERWRRPDIVVKGFQRDVAPLMRECSLMLLPSRNEGLPKALIEGAACGLPVLATREAGFPIRDGETGFFVTRDPADIARRLRELYASPSTLTGMGNASRELAVATFSWERFMSRFRASLETLLA